MNDFERLTATPERDPEIEAEDRLDDLLADPDYRFLSDVPQNRERIDNADSAVEALSIAQELIMRRLERTFEFRTLKPIEGVEMGEVSVESIKETINTIKANQQLIGEGGDAFVVVDKNEIRELPPEICYKFAKEEETKRGRNSLSREAEIHADFYRAVETIGSSQIGVPMPFYVTEIGSDKMLAMEKLPARSVADVLRGIGSVPEWLDVDAFCDELEVFFQLMHERGLYHRDVHEGNIMICQTPEPPQDGKWGYLIDFGLSGHGEEDMDPYVKETNGTRFTYSKDNAIINKVRHTLKIHQARQRNPGSS
jgi:serine/threonine protein kinase